MAGYHIRSQPYCNRAQLYTSSSLAAYRSHSQKDGCLWAVFVAYLLRGFFQKRRFGLKNYNSITSFSPMLRNRRSRCLPSVGHLFQDHSRTIMTFCLQNCLQCYEMAFFIGYQVEGCFSSVKVQKSSICSLTSE